jgi:LacI family transcriptional regulator
LQSGLSVPGDVSVAGFNDSEGGLMDPPLTSVTEFPEELGKHLADFVLRRIQEPDREFQQLTIPTRLVLRGSTRSITDSPRSVRMSAPAYRPPEV